ncbi:hypothetical protein D3C80_1154790 [compost metagenome]
MEPAPSPSGKASTASQITEEEYENPNNARAVTATLIKVTLPVPRRCSTALLAKLEIIVPPTTTMDNSPAVSTGAP